MLRMWPLLIFLAVAVPSIAPASALADGECVKVDLVSADCRAGLGGSTSSDSGGSHVSVPSGSAASSASRKCHFSGALVPCQSGAGDWSASAQAWCRVASPEPPRSDAVWEGRDHGFIFECRRPNGSLVPDPALVFHRWAPDAEAMAAPDPAEIAGRILARLDLQAPELGMFPAGVEFPRSGIVGWETWLWAEPATERQWGPVTASESEGGVTVTLTARVESVAWDMGNGDTVRCGKGTRWTEARTRGLNVGSPDCGYVYESKGTYTVAASSNWQVTWTGGGRSGTIPLELTRERIYQVKELQSVNVPGGS